MNYDREEYMRRQEQDHDLLSMRTRWPSRTATYHTRAQRSADAIRATWLAHGTALGRRTDLANTLDAGVRFLRSMKDQGASKDALHDMAASIHDQVQNIESGINRDLDDQGGAPEGAVDMAELDGFLKELGT